MIQKTHIIVLLALILTILIVWLPTGFQTAGIQEEWRYRAPFDGNAITYNDIGRDSSEEQFYTRPFYGVMNGLAYVLTPDSFLSHHFILIVLLITKGFALFLIFKIVFPSFPLWGYLCALLLIFYPSDPGIVSFRTFHHHLAIVMILLSIYFLIAYYRFFRTRYLILMWLCQAVAGLSSESGYPIFLVTPLIILILEKRLSRRFIIMTILFYIVPATTFLYSYILIVVMNVSWQSTAITLYPIREYLKNVYELYEHNFLTAWRDIIDYFITAGTVSDVFVFAATSLVAFIGSIWILRQENPPSNRHPSPKTFVIVLLVGVIAVLFGYAMFISSRTHVLTNFRVHLLSSVGLAVVIGTVGFGLFYGLTRYHIKFLILIGLSMLVGLSCVFANKTQHEYLEISNQHESLVRQIAEVVPALKNDAHIVIKMPSNGNMNRLSLGEIQKPVLFTPLLQYIYNDYDQIQSVVLCFTSYLDCDFTPDGMMIHASNFLNIELPIQYNQLILFNISKEGNLTFIEQDDTLTGYGPSLLIDSNAPQPQRIESIYGR